MFQPFLQLSEIPFQMPENWTWMGSKKSFPEMFLVSEKKPINQTELSSLDHPRDLASSTWGKHSLCKILHQDLGGSCFAFQVTASNFWGGSIFLIQASVFIFLHHLPCWQFLCSNAKFWVWCSQGAGIILCSISIAYHTSSFRADLLSHLCELNPLL